MIYVCNISGKCVGCHCLAMPKNQMTFIKNFENGSSFHHYVIKYVLLWAISDVNNSINEPDNEKKTPPKNQNLQFISSVWEFNVSNINQTLNIVSIWSHSFVDVMTVKLNGFHTHSIIIIRWWWRQSEFTTKANKMTKQIRFINSNYYENGKNVGQMRNISEWTEKGKTFSNRTMH